MKSQNLVILADFINPIDDHSCELVRNAAIVLKPSARGWRISHIEHSEKVLRSHLKTQFLKILDYRGFLMMPGFFDMHFHWVQDDVRLMPKDSLLTWLEKYTWPHEMKFKSARYTRVKAHEFSQKLIKMGTLGGACFGSIHKHSVERALEHFVGDFIVGNVLMTMNSPKGLRQTKKGALGLIAALASLYKKRYALTPRFAPTTHPEVMKEGARLAKKHGSFIQSHLCETQQEINYVMGLYKDLPGFEDVESYTEIYQRCGILSAKTIMGHGIYLTDDEWKILKQTRSALAHCPTSNASVKNLGLGSGLFDFEKADRLKIPWALGSDIGGGPYLSMFDVMNSFVDQNKKKKGATYTKAFYRATLAGAELLGKDKDHGSLAPGKWANFILVESPRVKPNESAESVLSTLLKPHLKKREAHQSMVQKTYYRGECVYSQEN